MKKVVAYMVVTEPDTVLYPPLMKDDACDFIAFTNLPTVSSKFWTIKFEENLIDIKTELRDSPEKFLFGYDKYIYIENEQIIAGRPSIDEDAVYKIPNIKRLLPEGYKVNEPNFKTADLNPTYTDGPYNGYPLQLSICVPISNRKDTLHKCLDGLKPLLDDLDAELIVVDTSTDGSTEIAKSYGAKIIPFTWNNDFAAARNVAIREACGAWILSIDDDEWFENVDEIIQFFRSNQWKITDMAHYKIRNYIDAEGREYNDFDAQRMAKNSPQLHYIYPIHEDFCLGVLDHKPVSKFFSCYAHHFGYVIKEGVDRSVKTYRNIAGLYTAIKMAPYEVRLYYQLCMELVVINRIDDAIAFCFKTLSICKLNNLIQDAEEKYISAHWNRITMIFLYTIAQLKHSDSLFDRTKLLTDFGDYNVFQKGMIYYFFASHAFDIQDYEAACDYAEKYYDARHEYLKTKSRSLLSRSITMDLVTPQPRYNAMLLMHGFALIKLQDFSKAEELFLNLKIPEVLDADKGFLYKNAYYLSKKSFKKLAAELKARDPEIMYNLYGFARYLDHDALQNNAQAKEPGYYFTNLDEKVSCCSVFNDDPYKHLLRIHAVPSDFSSYNWFSQSKEYTEKFSGELCLPAAMHGYPLDRLSSLLTLEGIQQMIRSLSALPANQFSVIFENYLRHVLVSSQFSTLSLETAYLWSGVLAGNLLNLSEEVFSSYEENYCDYFTCYIYLLQHNSQLNYNAAMFEAENISLLPATIRAALFIVNALNNVEDKDVCLGYMKKAVAECPLFDRGVKLLLSRLLTSRQRVEQPPNQTAAKSEFELLGAQLKSTARQMIKIGNTMEAQGILQQLSALLPQDTEIQELLTKCNTIE